MRLLLLIMFFTISPLALIGCASSPVDKYSYVVIALPKDISINGVKHSCINTLYSSVPGDGKYPFISFRYAPGELIGYICVKDTSLELVFVSSDFEFRVLLENTFNSFLKTGNVSIPWGGKEEDGTIWHGSKAVYKDDPYYFAAFGESFQDELGYSHFFVGPYFQIKHIRAETKTNQALEKDAR